MRPGIDVPGRRFTREGKKHLSYNPWTSDAVVPAFLGKLSSCNSQSRGRICSKGPTFDVIYRKLSRPFRPLGTLRCVARLETA